MSSGSVPEWHETPPVRTIAVGGLIKTKPILFIRCRMTVIVTGSHPHSMIEDPNAAKPGGAYSSP